MQSVTQDWIDAQAEDICPESFIEITFIKAFGGQRTYDKTRIMSFQRNDYGSTIMARQTSQSITFSLDNSDGEFDNDKPTQWFYGVDASTKVQIAYGLDINGTTEWINPAAWYWITDIKQDVNAMQTKFTATDIFGVMNSEYTGARSQSQLVAIIIAATNQEDAPDGYAISSYSSAADYAAAFGSQSENAVNFTGDESNYTISEILQYAAAACGRVLWSEHGRYYKTRVLSRGAPDYVIPTNTLLKWAERKENVKYKAVRYQGRDGNGDNVAGLFLMEQQNGEILGMYNPLTYMGNTNVSGIVRDASDVCINHPTCQFAVRFDPALDLFDLVSVEKRSGEKVTGYIESIKARYTGAWQADVVIRELFVGTYQPYAGETYSMSSGDIIYTTQEVV